MINDSDKIAEIKAAISKHNGLVLDLSGDKVRVYGEIDIKRPEDDALITSFSIEIVYPDEYPRCFPKVIETGGRIERILDRHVYPADDTLCLAVPVEERLLCIKDINTSWFLDKVLLPRLAEEYQVINGGRYTHGYAHGNNGRWEFYMRHLNTNDTSVILHVLDYIIKNDLPKGYTNCFCNSGRKFNQCHLKSVVELKRVGVSYLKTQYKLLNETPYVIPNTN